MHREDGLLVTDQRRREAVRNDLRGLKPRLGLESLAQFAADATVVEQARRAREPELT
jgi:hypothetical protein